MSGFDPSFTMNRQGANAFAQAPMEGNFSPVRPSLLRMGLECTPPMGPPSYHEDTPLLRGDGEDIPIGTIVGNGRYRVTGPSVGHDQVDHGN
jgi:hypothetical protein